MVWATKSSIRTEPSELCVVSSFKLRRPTITTTTARTSQAKKKTEGEKSELGYIFLWLFILFLFVVVVPSSCYCWLLLAVVCVSFSRWLRFLVLFCSSLSSFFFRWFHLVWSSPSYELRRRASGAAAKPEEKRPRSKAHENWDFETRTKIRSVSYSFWLSSFCLRRQHTTTREKKWELSQ